MSADRVALEGLKLLVREWVREILAEERPASPSAAEGYIGASEAGRRAGVSSGTIRGWVRAGKLHAVKPAGTRGFKIKPSDLAAFMSGAHAGAQPVASPPPIDLAARRLVTSIPRGRK